MDLTSMFEKISYEEINRFINEKQEENLTIEFKTIKHASFNSEDDRRNYAKCLSGFANSNGGLINWGVDARKNADQIDCASEEKPIEDINLFISRLNELEHDAVSPNISGVLHKSIVLHENVGFCVTLVPESESGPHMAKYKEYRYYKRSGDTFYKMEHFDIEDMFGRRKKPNLKITFSVESRKILIIIFIGIKNIGRGSAIGPYLSFKLPEPFILNQYGVDGNGHEGLPRILSRENRPWVNYGGDNLKAIHPNTNLDVASIIYDPNRGKKLDSTIKDINLEYKVAADGLTLREYNVRIPLNVSELLQK